MKKEKEFIDILAKFGEVPVDKVEYIWKQAYKKGYTDASKNIRQFAESCELLHNQDELLEEMGLKESEHNTSYTKFSEDKTNE